MDFLQFIQNQRALLNGPNPLRGNVYANLIQYYQQNFSGSQVAGAIDQLIIQASITTNSGDYGAGGLIGNTAARLEAGSRYNLTLDQFSKDIIERMLDAIEYELLTGRDGLLSAQELHFLDYSVWRQHGMGELFPGNAQRWDDFRAGFNAITGGSVIFDSALYDMHRYGGNPFAPTRSTLDDHIWSWSPLIFPAAHNSFAMLLAQFGNSAQLTASSFGLSNEQMYGLVPNQLTSYVTSADGRYRGYLQSYNNKLVFSIRDMTIGGDGGEVVALYDPNADLYGDRLFGLAKPGAEALDSFFRASFGPGVQGQIAYEYYLKNAHDIFRNYTGFMLDAGSSRNLGPITYTPSVPSMLEQYRCFIAGTPILLANGQTTAIESVSVGDEVAAFEGLGPLVPGVVTVLLRNSSDSIFMLEGGVGVTPFHPFLCEDGTFRTAEEILRDGLRVVRADGESVVLRGQRIEGEDLTKVGGYRSGEGVFIVDTYNFTVADLHTYVAGGFRVHNTSLVDDLPGGFEARFGLTNPDGTQIITAIGADGSIGLFSGRDIDGDGDTDLESYKIFHPDQQGRAQHSTLEEGKFKDLDNDLRFDTLESTYTYGPITVTFTRRGDENAEDPRSQWSTVDDSATFHGIDVGSIGNIFGSTLGRLLSDNQMVGTISSIVLGAIGENLAEAFARSAMSDIGLAGAVEEMFADLPNDIRNGAIGAVSSYLTAELVDALGLEGTLGELAQSVGSAVLTQIIKNLADMAAGVQGVTTFSNITPAMFWNVVGSYIGAKLASKVIDFETLEGQIGAQLGTAVGAMAGAKWGAQMGGQIGGFYGAVIGAFVGYILGGLIGDSIGTKPQARSTVIWSDRSDGFVVGTTRSKGHGSKPAAAALAYNVAQSLNSIIEATGAKLVDGADVRAGEYGMKSKDYVYWSASHIKSRNVQTIIQHGIYVAVSDMVTRLAGGDVYSKRALVSSMRLTGAPVSAHIPNISGSFDLNGLFGDIAVARDFARYLENRAFIQASIQADPNSTYAAGWAVTLARASELGLRKRSFTDWIGGFGTFLDQILDSTVDGVAVGPGNVLMQLEDNARFFGLVDANGDLVRVIEDTVDTDAKDRIAGTSGDDVITVNANTIANAAGLTINETAASGSHTIDFTAIIDAGAGNDLIRVGDLGNDALGGDGDDVLIGGKLDDWLFGDAGNDTLFAASVGNPTFQISDTAAESAAVGGWGGNGDMLDGGEGDDRLYGSAGSEWLRGGSGADRLVGGAGGDILDAGAGDDRGQNGEAAILGGAGSDQYVFGFGDGKDVVFDEADTSLSAGEQDALDARYRQISNGTLLRNWGGVGDYEIDGSVRGGEDAISFGVGISMANLVLRRSGDNLVIALMAQDASGNGVLTGDELTVQDWFLAGRRIEWLRFADGEDIRLGDLTSMVIGSSESDVILGSYGADFLYGGAGDDVIRALAGDDFVNGGSGNDFVAGDGDNDWVMGGSGNDKVLGGSGHDTLFGDAGDDLVYGGLGANSGSDLIAGGLGNDTVVGGAGDDVFRYSRGDGQDVVMDDFVNNWDLVWQSGVYVNGYVLQADGTVTKNGVVYFDGSKWLGQYDWNDETGTLKRHGGAVNGVSASNAGTDTLEFGVGIDIQDVQLRRNGDDLQLAVTGENSVASFDAVGDRVTIKDWFTVGKSIENFVFASTGRHAVGSMNLGGGGDGDDTLTGTAGEDWLTANAGDDVIDSGAGDDILAGNAGNDTLRGSTGTDVLFGGAGDDVLDGGAGADFVAGGEGLDVASYSTQGSGLHAYLDFTYSRFNTGDAVGDSLISIEGLQGSAAGGNHLGGDSDGNVLIATKNDVLYGGGGEDTYEVGNGDTGVRIAEGHYAIEEVFTSAGAFNGDAFTASWEVLQTFIGNEELGIPDRYIYKLTITRTADGAVIYFDNSIESTSESPAVPAFATWIPENIDSRLLTTGKGGQVIREAFGTDDGAKDQVALDAGISLSDLTIARTATGLSVAGSNFSVAIDGGGAAVETLQLDDGLSVDLTKLVLAGEGATASDDLMFGTAGADTLDGLAGDDVIAGLAGNDTLRGGDGNDTLEGGVGADTFDGGNDSVSVGATAQAGMAYGDTIRYLTSNAGVIVDLAASTASGGHATGDVLTKTGNGLSSIENVSGSDGFGDTLSGDARANRLAGYGGNDMLDGRAGDDILVGGAGDDTLYGGDGADGLAGDDGIDRLEGGLGNDLISGGFGSDTLLGDAGDDQLSGEEGDDTLYGGTGKDTLGGWDGNDVLFGDADDDKLAGGAGNDILDGGAGNDILGGEAGNDQLKGGTGDDAYVFDGNSGTDTIIDVSGLKNEIVLTDVDASRIWFSRSGDDLVISVIGGSTVITLDNFLRGDAASTRMFKITSTSGALFFNAATPLIDAMAQASVSVPASLPQSVVDLLDTYWHVGGKSAPTVVDQIRETDEDVAIFGQVDPTDHDGNITGYTLSEGPSLGSVMLDANTGAWMYTPGANAHGQDHFVVKVTDADGNSVEQRVDVEVRPVNDAPSAITGPATLAVDEGSANGTMLGSFTASDADGDTLTFQLIDNAGGRFALTPQGTLSVINGAGLNYEANASHTISVRVVDSAGGILDKSFVVNVRNVNEAPYIVAPPPTTVPAVLAENATGGTAAAFVIGDPDNTTPSLVLTSNPNGWLEVAGSSVRIRSGVAIDFEQLAAAGATLEDTDGDGIREIRFNAAVKASDGSLSSATATSFSFLIEDVNERPTNITLTPSVSSIAERDRPASGVTRPAIVLGTLTTADPDTTTGSDFATFAYTVVGDSRFEVVGNQLRLKADQWLDYEAGATVTVRIRVTDRGGQAGGLSYEKDFTFTVDNRDDYLYGTTNVDTLTGQANRDLLYGYGGADTLLGGTGNDDLYGGDGNDVLQGEDGDDKLWGELGDDTLLGDLGSDTLRAGDGNDILEGGDGDDVLYGEAGNDEFHGDAGNDILDGGLGNDLLRGGPGDDQLLGGEGDDTMFGGAGADRFDGGVGYDTVTYEWSGSGVSLDLTTGGTLNGAAGDTYTSIERVVGSAYADTLVGGSGHDVLEGGTGDDVLRGGDGNDRLDGGDGNDTIDAGAGGDQLIGGTGNDILIGGSGSDVYLIDLNSGADEIQNYDPNGTDIDAIGYSDIDRKQLWFSRSGDDLVISVIGTAVQTTVKNWYLTATTSERANYKIDFIISGSHYSDTIDAEALVNLMAGYTKPGTQAAYDALHANLAFENRWKQYWDANGAPVISSVINQTVAEDGTLTLQFTVTDDITPVTGLTVVAKALRPGTQTLETVLVNAPTVSAPDADGQRTVTVTTKANTSGQVQISLQATDPGGLVSERSFLLTIDARADAPVITVAKAVAAAPTLDSGTLALDIQSALVDQDGSETLEIRISNLPTGLTLNQGTNLGNGVWSLTPAQLSGLAIVGPSTWSQDLTGTSALTVTAITRETSNGNTAQTTRTLAFTINARPTDLAADRALAINESTATTPVANGTLVANFSRTDADNDAASYSLLDNAGGRFVISSAGVLTVANGTLLDREAAASHVIRVRVTDSGGLTHDEDFTITVNNVNEAPTTPTLSSQPIVMANENTALAGQVVANLAATDPDGTTPAFVITSDPRGWFTISGSQLKIASGVSFDFEALKAAGLTVGDSDGDGRQEVVYSAVVKAADGALDSPSTRTITLRIEDANDTPADIAVDRTLTIAENVANGTLVGNFSATDQDVGDVLSLSLVNNAGGRFALNAAGALTVANGTLLNFEAATSHVITVRVTDAGGLTRDENFTIAVSNVNEAPTTPVTTKPLVISTEGTALANQVVATFTATDPDGTAPGFVLASDPKGWFAMSGNQLMYRSTFNSDFEALVAAGGVTLTDMDGDGQLEASYSATVRSTDGSLTSAGATTVTVYVEDTNEAPTANAATFTVNEGSPGAGQTLIGTVSYTDPDSQAYNRDPRFSLTGGDTARFSINATTGQLYLQGTLDYETATSHQVQVTVRDRAGTGASSTAWVTINVGAVNERPNIQFVNTRLYKSDPEGAATTFVVLSVDKVISTHVIHEDTWTGEREEYDYGSTQAVTTAGALQNYADGTAAVALNASYREWYEGNWGDPRGSGAGYYRTYQETTSYVVTIVSQDASGLRSDPIRVICDLYAKYLGPVVLDLDRNGLSLIANAASTTQFDMDGDGARERTGWVGSGDGLLVLDRNHDGRIDSGAEISFAADKPGAASDLEGLAAYDSNNDGLFSALDARFGEFQVWQDVNQDGVSQANELATLTERGIEHIGLAGVRTGAQPNAYENVVYANSTFGYADGSTGVVGDVFLAYQTSIASLLASTGVDTPDPAAVATREPRLRSIVNGELAEEVDTSTSAGVVAHGGRDRGTGDAAPGRVNRTADRDHVEHPDMAPRQIDLPEVPGPAEPIAGQVGGHRPTEAVPDKIAPALAEVESSPSDYEPANVAARSALHDSLAIAQKKRFQMIEAMVTFSAEPFVQQDFGANTNDPRALELLTALPDYRITTR